VKEFQPPFLLRNSHFMTVAGTFWRRSFPTLTAAEAREFETEPGSRVLVKCHWQPEPQRHSTIVVLHGLEGSSESGYMLGIAEKALRKGFNVLRANQRNCGGTDRLTPTLYSSAMSCDMRAIVEELIAKDHLPEIFVAGYSMGGNLVLKMAGEMADATPKELRGVIAVCPSSNLAACADALGKRQNVLYQNHFVRSLKKHTRAKAAIFPDAYPLNGLDAVKTVREFDEVITAKFCGYTDADDYYQKASALRVAREIRVPTLLIAAEDDPIVPIETLCNSEFASNPNVTIVTVKHGGHCGFISQERGEERFWVEARIVEYCKSQSSL
jgi:predicted alpha/beta-fold hydrolase